MPSATPLIQQDLVLIGGGHSHAIVLRLWAMHPIPGVRLTLISDGADTPYSGMLPGHVAGFYSREDCHIDLRSLCQFAGAVFYCDHVIGLDLANQQVICANHPPVGYDQLSIDIGSTPKLAVEHQALIGRNAIPAKPVPQFLQWWDGICEQLQTDPTTRCKLAIVGGGVGGVELAINMQRRLQALVADRNWQLHLFSRAAVLLPQQNAWVQTYFQTLLCQRGVQLHLGTAVTGWDGALLQTDRHPEPLDFDTTVWVTQATAPDWLATAGLAVDDRGFIAIDEYLQSISHPSVFAAGDIASMVDHPRPKAGVFAVRQGKPLYKNLCRTLRGQKLQQFVPQKRYLSLIGTGNRQAVAVWGKLACRLPLLWQWKDWIDRQFMAKFDRTTLGQVARHSGPMSAAMGDQPLPHGMTAAAGMHCAGCGAKVGSSVLTQVLERIQTDQITNSVLIGLAQPDDAAVLQVPPDRLLVQTVDYFPALVDDPFLFGQIATHHSLSDLFAMGATADSVLAIVSLPYAAASQQQETLFQLLSGALKALAITHTQLVGGHTIEGEKLMFGLTCNGFTTPERLLQKTGMAPGDCLILTKPLGTGTLFAAQMRYQAKPQWIDAAIATMLQSNYLASKIFLNHKATACTDVTGFGLLGHLVEMLQAATPPLQVTLQLTALPLLPGALQTTQQGIVSSLYAQNQRAQNWIENLATIAQHSHFPLLFDPQTSGGLLASVPAEQATACCTALQAVGYTSAIIGQIHPALEKSTLPITIEA